MKIRVIAFGTRGDVQPIVALGLALQARGHQVRMVTSINFRSWVEELGLEAAASSVDIQELMMGEGGLDWVEHGTNQVKQMRIMKQLLDEHGLTLMNDAWSACQDGEVIMSSFTSDVYAASIAEKIGAYHVSTPLQPTLIATRSGYAAMQAPVPNRYSIINYLFGKALVEPAGWRLMGASTNRFRESTLELPAQSYQEARQMLDQMLIVQGHSAHVVPHPDDWPLNTHTAGYWFLDLNQDWQAPANLTEFLASGDKPVYIGFGSMTGRDPASLTHTVTEAVKQSGRRAILQSGWAGIGNIGLPTSIYLLRFAPHNWLFPQMAAVVHHGGAGSTAESLRAGVPTIVVPHMADQPFWGARIAAIGAGPKPIPRNRLTIDKLASAIQEATTSSAINKTAAELGARIRSEEGISVAIELIEDYLGIGSK